MSIKDQNFFCQCAHKFLEWVYVFSSKYLIKKELTKFSRPLIARVRLKASSALVDRNGFYFFSKNIKSRV